MANKKKPAPAYETGDGLRKNNEHSYYLGPVPARQAFFEPASPDTDAAIKFLDLVHPVARYSSFPPVAGDFFEFLWPASSFSLRRGPGGLFGPCRQGRQNPDARRLPNIGLIYKLLKSLRITHAGRTRIASGS